MLHIILGGLGAHDDDFLLLILLLGTLLTLYSLDRAAPVITSNFHKLKNYILNRKSR